MATRFVASGGSNTSPYETWAKAATSLATALAASTATGDIIVIQHDAVPSGDAELSADTTYTFAGNVALISASNDGGSDYTPVTMGTSTWIGNSTTFRGITLAGGFRVYILGVTFRTAGATADVIAINTTTGGEFLLENCYLWEGNSATGGRIDFHTTNGSVESYTRLVNCTLRFGNTAQMLSPGSGTLDLVGCTISSAGSAPSTLFGGSVGASSTVNFHACDLSHITGTLVGNQTNGQKTVRFTQCVLGSGVVLMGTQSTYGNRSQAQVYAFDCASGDTHTFFGYYDGLGSVVSDTSIYFTAGAAAQSWKIVTTANASYQVPFLTPPISMYNSATSAVTPYLEILRDGSATAYQDDQVWLELTAKTTSGFPLATVYADKRAFTASAADQAAGAGLGSWTGEAGTAWSGKIDSGASLTPAEVGDFTARIAVGAASATVYVDPQIRT